MVEDFQAPEATIIYSSDGVVLGRVYREDRTNVPLEKIPRSLRDATVAVEDSRFYEHAGVDMKGIARAIYTNVRGQRLAQGGSTITQQLARNVYLTQRKTFQRKIQEAVLAILIERRYDKDKILEMYLNQVYFGSGAFGVQAAAKVYFGKDLDKLTLGECALLAGLPRRPSAYSPHENLQAALDRRDVVLNRMAELGTISPGERDAAKNEKIAIIKRQRGRSTYKAPHFVDYVSRQLKERYGDDILYMGGLRVHTSLNYEMQKIAEKALREGVVKHAGKKVGEGCMVVIEPANGYVRAMVGSVDPASHFNRCTQAERQPGSAFKVFVYTAALDAGMKPTDREIDAPVSYPDGRGRYWRPKNYDNRFRGSVTLERAVAESINIPAIKICDKVGVHNVIRYARAMGIKAKLEPYLPLAIGGIGGVKPIEMASAYGTFANGGVHVEPVSIVRVTNSHGDTIEDYTPEGVRVISERVNQMMDSMLRAVVVKPGGTGHRMRDVAEARGKTGTTNDDRDAWWIGYVPNKLVAAVWVGNDNYAPMRRAWGGTVCGPIWREFMLKAIPIYDKTHKPDKPAQRADREADKSPNSESERSREVDREPEAPTATDTGSGDTTDTVTAVVCSESQMLARPGCPVTHTQRFVRGFEPTSYCTVHGSARAASETRPEPKPEVRPEPRPEPRPVPRPTLARDQTLVTVTVCAESGLLASPGCPRTVRKRVPLDEVPAQVCGRHPVDGDR